MPADEDLHAKYQHLDEKSKHLEKRLDDHGDDIGKIYSMVHDLVVKVAVVAMEHGAFRKLIYGAIATALLLLAAKFAETI